MTHAKWKALGFAIAVFVVGTGFGFGLGHARAWRTIHHTFEASREGGRSRMMVTMLSRRLDLTTEQHAKVEAIVAAHSTELEAIRRDAEPKLRPIHEKMHEEIKAVLDDHQKQRFETITERMRHRRGGAGPASF